MLLTTMHSLLLVLLSLSSVFAHSLIVHEKRDVPHQNAIDRRRIDPNAVLPMRLGLKQNEEATLKAETWLMSVSHPESPQYGRHWTQQDVIDAFKPTDETVQTVTDWLSSHGIHGVTHSDNRMWIAFDITAKEAETIFHTEYFEHQRSNGRFEVSCDHYYLPQHLQSHVDYITPGIKGSDITGRTARSQLYKRRRSQKHSHRRAPRTALKSDGRIAPLTQNASSLALCDRLVTPACLRALYGFTAPDPTQPVSSTNSLGIFEEEDLCKLNPVYALYAVEEQYEVSVVKAGSNPAFVGQQ